MKMIKDNQNTRGLRVYEEGPQYELYKEMHENQTYEWVGEKLEEYSFKNHRKTYTISYVLKKMDQFIDPSDPDVELPNSIHCYQTAERIRRIHPKNYTLQLCGLIHDLGKILFEFGEPSWAVVGDTYPLGCKIAENIVYRDTFENCPDQKNELFKSKYGIYEKNCGIGNLRMSFGHDEYLYRVLEANSSRHYLPEKYWNIIRFHSFYPWHTYNEYRYFMNENDEEMLNDIIDFNSYDLYSKEDCTEITEEINDYYHCLLLQYFPNPLRW